jgi:hypothetical protein
LNLTSVVESDPSSLTVEGRSAANRPTTLGLCLLAGFAFCLLFPCSIQSASALELASAQEVDARAGSGHLISPKRELQPRTAEANALASREASIESAPDSARKPKLGSAKGPYYVDFRARTAASWGHAFVWFGKTGEREVEVAGLTPQATPCNM